MTKLFGDEINAIMTNAKQGDAQAQYHLALCYHHGLGVAKDLEKAFFWYARASRQDCQKNSFKLQSLVQSMLA